MLWPWLIHTKNYFTETKRNKTLFFKKRNEIERFFFFWNWNWKPKRNKYFSETKRNEKKIRVFNPCFKLVFQLSKKFNNENHKFLRYAMKWPVMKWPRDEITPRRNDSRRNDPRQNEWDKTTHDVMTGNEITRYPFWILNEFR
jgi:hypothetical protein